MPGTLRETRFADNFERLLGVHRLSARDAAELLQVSTTTLSYWRNGRREPDRDSLYNVSIFFLVDPWDIMEADPHDFLSRHLADRERFESVERQIAQRKTVDDLMREAEAKESKRRPRRPAVDHLLERLETQMPRASRASTETVSKASPKLRKLQAVREGEAG